MFRPSFRHLIRLLPVLILAAPAAAAPPTPSMDHLCRAGAEAAAKAADLPAGLLTAISLRETGRWSARLKTNLTWPWTVTASGRGHYLNSKAAAIAFVKRLRKRGVSNIDVGCMQINLHYHTDAFANLQDAFDPRRNAGYAADFLARLRVSHGSLAPAVARYHSGDPARGARYRTGVFELWLNQPKATNHQAIAAAQQAAKKAAWTGAEPLKELLRKSVGKRIARPWRRAKRPSKRPAPNAPPRKPPAGPPSPNTGPLI